MERLNVGVVHTFASECHCHVYIIDGLKQLGHDHFEVDSEEVILCLDELAQADFVFDHTDTYLGEGQLRPFVRWHLESAGARVIGSDFRACYFTDNKIASKKILADGMIPTPRCQVLYRPSDEAPSCLDFPVVMKPAFQHLSRGLALARDLAEYQGRMKEMAQVYKEPLLIEEYIPGREIGVSLVGNDELSCLPITEINLGMKGAEPRVYSYQAKAVKESQDYQDRTLHRPAIIEPEIRRKINELAKQAYRLFNIKDYCRFDLRLAGGVPYFLEVNTKPSFKPDSGLTAAARHHGWENQDLIQRLLSYAGERDNRKQTDAGKVSDHQRR